MTKYKEILRYRSLGYSQRQIADILGTSRNTTKKVYAIADSLNLDWNHISAMTEDEVANLLYPKHPKESLYKAPDCDYLQKELQKKGVTLTLLWREYVTECHASDCMPLQYVQFCNHYRNYCKTNKATMHFNHSPGERIEVDWAGTIIPIYNSYTGEIEKAYLFVATLPYSQYSYVEVMDNMKQENWINAHINMFNFFGGVTPMIYPDNLKTGVTKHPKDDDVILNKDYEELGDYYGTAIVPAMPRTPKGKPSVEGTVGKVTTHIIAKLRNEKFSSVYEAQVACLKALHEFNEAPFQKRDGSRKEVFLTEEKITLKSLPRIQYEYGKHKICSVQFNYHIAIEKNYYSVPYEYIGCKVNARITNKIIEVYYENKRICSHTRLYGRTNQYSTNVDHMPPSHQEAAEWNSERLRNWAKKIGPSTYDVVDRLLKSYRVEQQGYTGCRSLLKLSDKYSNLELELACRNALKHLSVPRYKNIKAIIESSQQSNQQKNTSNQNDTEGAYLRGASYYGGHNE